jgi:hypothetical protein
MGSLAGKGRKRVGSATENAKAGFAGELKRATVASDGQTPE